MKSRLLAVLIILGGIVGLGGLWIVDIANAVPGALTNGFWEITSQQAFHLALWTSIGAYLMIIATAIIILVIET